MDWSTVVILAAVTWLDGWRRVPAGALVLRHVLGGQWSVADREPDAGLRLVAWWNPLSLALIVPAGGVWSDDSPAQQTQDALAGRLANVRRIVNVLRILGAVVIVAIVFGIPAAIARFDAWGLALSLGLVVLLSAAVAFIVSVVLRRAGHSWRQSARTSAPLLYPFAAPRAAEFILLHAISGAAPLMVARQLLGPANFAMWIRPHAYDALEGRRGAADSSALLALLGRSGMAQIVAAAPTNCASGERYCSRCARIYRSDAATCADCRGLPLTAHDAG